MAELWGSDAADFHLASCFFALSLQLSRKQDKHINSQTRQLCPVLPRDSVHSPSRHVFTPLRFPGLTLLFLSQTRHPTAFTASRPVWFGPDGSFTRLMTYYCYLHTTRIRFFNPVLGLEFGTAPYCNSPINAPLNRTAPQIHHVVRRFSRR